MDGILEIVEARESHWESIRILRTHPKLQEGFIDQVSINEKQQKEYMKKYHKFYWVARLNEKTVGFVGVVENDIRVAVDPEFHKRGIAKNMILFIRKKYPDAIARVKIKNENSLKLFQSVGFKINGFEKKKGELLYLMS